MTEQHDSPEPILEVRLLQPDAELPTQAYPGDAGLDLVSAGHYNLYPGDHRLIRTGIAVRLPYGTAGLVTPRSGQAARNRVTVLNAPGVIDQGYTGEIMVNLINHGDELFRVDPGIRIAQLLIVPVVHPVVIQSHDLGDTARGARGHGSSGR